MRTPALVVLLVAGAASFAFASYSQPEPGTEKLAERAPREVQPREGQPREAATARLQRRLEEAQRQQARLAAAIKRLEAGEPVEDVMRDLDAGRPGQDDRGARPWRDGMGPESRGPERQDRPGPPGAGRPPEGPAGPEAEEVRAFIQQRFPEIWRRFEDLRKGNPEVAERHFGRFLPKVREAMALRESDPEMFEMRVEEIRGGIDAMVCVREYREALSLPEGDTARSDRLARAEADLRRVLGEQFDLRLRLQEHELRMLSSRVESLRKEIEEKRGERDAAVTDMLERISRGGPPDGGKGRPPGRPGGPGGPGR
ncbi:MAG: hypothetical protein DYG92_13775 [Leptolyngbya sp. PLA1]|nr:hypothetical protein [Leptolyngbya sp. PLA1]